MSEPTTFTTEQLVEMLQGTKAQNWDGVIAPTLLLCLEDGTNHNIEIVLDQMMALLPPFLVGMTVAKEVQQATLNFRTAFGCEVGEAVFAIEGLWQHEGDDCNCGINASHVLNAVHVRRDGTWEVVQVPCEPSEQRFEETVVTSDNLSDVGGQSEMLTAALLIAVADVDPQTGEVQQDLVDDIARARAEYEASGLPKGAVPGMAEVDDNGIPQIPEGLMDEIIQPDAIFQGGVSLQDYFSDPREEW